VQTAHGWHLFAVEQQRFSLSTKHCRTPARVNPNRASRKAPDSKLLPPVPRTYAIQTLGCQMNRSDSERMYGQLESLGFREVDDVDRAALLVLNTCNIREHAESKVYSYLGKHVSRKRKFPRDVTLAVAGCVAQQEGERMLRRVPELDLVFGPQYVNRLEELLEDVKVNGCKVATTEPAHVLKDISKPKRQSDYILKVMRPGYTAEHYIKIVNRIREHIPDASICGDLIVGFPTETEEQFENSLKLMETIKFDVMNTAAYSPRPSTPAAVMDGQIAEEVKAERLARVNRVFTEHALERSMRYVGRTEEVSVENQNPRDASQVVGRSKTNRPVHFAGDISLLKGKLVDVRVSKAFAFSLQGEAVGEAR